MIVETSAAQTRTNIAKCLLEFILGSLDGEEVALDLCELIALRMPAATNDEIATVGFYVRANLVAVGRGKAPYCEVLHNLAEATIMAPLGFPELKRSIEAGLDELLR